MEIYPNPTSSNFTISIPATLTKKSRITIVDLTGRILWTRNFDTMQEVARVEMDPQEIANMGPGMYMVTLETSENVMTKPLIVN